MSLTWVCEGPSMWRTYHHDYDMVEWFSGEWSAYFYPRTLPYTPSHRFGKFPTLEAAKAACQAHADALSLTHFTPEEIGQFRPVEES